MSYLVTSPLVLVKVPDQVGDGYRVDYHYQGSVIPWLSNEQTEHFLAEGMVEEVDGDESDEDAVPDSTWTRAEIDAWAEANGLDTTGAANKGDALALIDEHLAA